MYSAHLRCTYLENYIQFYMKYKKKKRIKKNIAPDVCEVTLSKTAVHVKELILLTLSAA